MRVKNNKRIKNLIFLSGLTAIILIVSTYAWFIGMRTVNVSSFDVEIAATDSLLLSFDGETWDSTISISEATLDEDSYTGHTNWWAGNGLIPMSSVGDMDTEASRMKLYEKASLTATPGGYRLLASRVNNYEVGALEQDGYVAFDLFVKNFSGTQYITPLNILDEEAIYLTTDSEVTVAASGVANTGIENSVRVAFAQIGRVIGTTTTTNVITGITCEPNEEGVPSVNGSVTGICRTAQIWEPNDTTHVANAISWYDTACVARTGLDVTLPASYAGNCGTIVDGTTYPTYAVSTEIESTDNVDVYDGLEYNTYEDSNLLYPYPYFTDTMKNLTGTDRPTFMMLAPNSITKVRVYIYIEGQDIDNYDFASIGKMIAVKFGFTKERFIEDDINYDGPVLDPENNPEPEPDPAPEPVLLKNIAAIGDYIAYDAGNWSSTVAVPTTHGSYGGYASGNSKNQGIACESAGALVSGRIGWRVIDVNSGTGEVSIIHVGTPECYYHSTDATGSITNLTTRDFSYYVNPSVATSASIFTKETAETLYGSSIAYASSLTSGTTIGDLLRSGSRYYFPTIYNSTYLFYVQPGGYVGGDRYKANGIRPVVKLKPDLYVLSGTGNALDKYVVNGTYTAPEVATKNGLITGYWENWNSASANLRIKNVPSYYDIVAISFGYTETGSSKGTVDFALDSGLAQRLNYTEAMFKNDIQILKASGKKVILSIGGAANPIAVDDTASINAFVSSVNGLITEYDLDGIDINFEEGMSPTHLATAIRQISNTVGNGFVLTMAPQTVDFKVNISGVASGDYYTLINSVKDITTIVNLQLYNSGGQYGLNGVEYFQGTVDFSTALATILIEKGLDDSQVGIGINYASTNGGYMIPSKFVDAYNSLISGGTTIGGSYVVPHAYTDLGGFMIWSINGDYGIGNSFSSAFNSALTY